MPRGLPKSYIQRAKRELGKGASFSQIFKKAWQLYKGSKVYKALKGNPRKKSSNPRKNPGKTKKKKGGRKMAKKTRRRRSFTIPLAATLGGTAGIWIKNPTWGASPIQLMMRGEFEKALQQMLHNYTGFDPRTGKWNIMEASGLIPAVVGMTTSWLASRLGLNRRLRNVPIIRI